MLEKLPYKGKYPPAANYLISEGVTNAPRQYMRQLKWANGLDIIYTLKKMTPANFRKYADTFLLLAFQEASRYTSSSRDPDYMKMGGFDIRLGRLKKGKDLPEEVTFQASLHDDPDIMVYGPGYDVPQRHFMYNKVEDILDITKRYIGKVSKQTPFRALRLFINIREPLEV